jgi:hypothetical protein
MLFLGRFGVECGIGSWVFRPEKPVLYALVEVDDHFSFANFYISKNQQDNMESFQ